MHYWTRDKLYFCLPRSPAAQGSLCKPWSPLIFVRTAATLISFNYNHQKTTRVVREDLALHSIGAETITQNNIIGEKFSYFRVEYKELCSYTMLCDHGCEKLSSALVCPSRTNPEPVLQKSVAMQQQGQVTSLEQQTLNFPPDPLSMGIFNSGFDSTLTLPSVNQ